MDTYEDWLRLNSIKAPEDYLTAPSLFTQVGILEDIPFLINPRRPKLSNGFSSNHQLLGPNVILRYAKYDLGLDWTKPFFGLTRVKMILHEYYINQTFPRFTPSCFAWTKKAR